MFTIILQNSSYHLSVLINFIETNIESINNNPYTHVLSHTHAHTHYTHAHTHTHTDTNTYIHIRIHNTHTHTHIIL